MKILDIAPFRIIRFVEYLMFVMEKEIIDQL